MCMSPSQLLLAIHTQLSSQLLAPINNATCVYIAHIPMYIYTYVYGVQKRPSTPIKWTLRRRLAGVSSISRRINRLYHDYNFQLGREITLIAVFLLNCSVPNALFLVRQEFAPDIVGTECHHLI